MKNRNLINKKIGIWGFGVVGKSAYNYFKQHTPHIQVLDGNKQDINCWIPQTEQNIISLFKDNDLILCSPGIKLHAYQHYKDKMITELDIFAQEFTGKTIGITGTLGKTSVTNLLQQCTPDSVAGGNIGYPMLKLLNHATCSTAILELSSFQLQQAQYFAPDIAIITNFYPNHLDHHKHEAEYFAAKCNIFKHQTKDQITLLPCNLAQQITNQYDIQSQIFLCCTEQCTTHDYPTFSIVSNKIQLYQNNQIITLLDNAQSLPTYTYLQNWVTIIATLYLQGIPIPDFGNTLINLEHQAHRMEYLGMHNGVKFYDDSKSTVWQATKQAIDNLQEETCVLILGGLSKGTDRSPLIDYVHNKPITIVAFGQEAESIQNLCNMRNIPCSSYKTLEDVMKACKDITHSKNILFSPAGASFDLFKNYIERGKRFQQLFKALQNSTTLL